MEIIPVLDLKGGSVVHAKQGQRDTYQPIASRLCATSAPDAVLAALLRLHAFRNVYVADLDAIETTGEHSSVIAELACRHSEVEFWIDSGDQATAAEPNHHNVRPVLGSESMRASKSRKAIAPTAILSLDFRGADFIGPGELLETPSLWPARVIVMTLARVGSSDLEALQRAGAAGVLVASALHDGRLTSADLAEFA
jgi:uncharacterized protein related to proFAR isomerase